MSLITFQLVHKSNRTLLIWSVLITKVHDPVAICLYFCAADTYQILRTAEQLDTLASIPKSGHSAIRDTPKLTKYFQMELKLMKPEIHHQDLGDVDIQYLRFPGTGPTIIALHATGFSPWLWLPIARALNNGCEVIAPYFCGHRKPDSKNGGVSWRVLAKDLHRLCEKLQIKNPSFVGHSMGAVIATITNDLMQNAAEKMILIEPVFLPQAFYGLDLTVEQHPLASKSIKRRNLWQDRAEVKSYFKSKPLFQNWDEEMLDLYIQYGTQETDEEGLTLTCSPQREAALFMGSKEYNPWPILSRTTCPTLIVEGETSDNRSFIDLPKAAEMMPKGSYTLIKEAGHLVTMEKPEEILALIKSFLF